MECSERMRKTRMLRRLVRKMCQSKLANPPESLKLGRIDEPSDQRPFGRVGSQTNDVMNRIAVDSF